MALSVGGYQMAIDPKVRRVFIAHTGRDRIEIIHHDQNCHVATLQGTPEAAGVVAHDAHILIRNAARPVSPSALTTHQRGRPGRSTARSRRLAPDQYCASIGSATLVVEA